MVAAALTALLLAACGSPSTAPGGARDAVAENKAGALATRAAVRIARAGDDLRARLAANIERLKQGMRANGLALMPSDTPIQPLLVGSDAHALAMAAALEERGYWVAAIRPPTVPEGGARLRIALSAAHDAAQIDGLLVARARARDALG